MFMDVFFSRFGFRFVLIQQYDFQLGEHGNFNITLKEDLASSSGTVTNAIQEEVIDFGLI